MNILKRLLSSLLICTYLSVFVYTPITLAANPDSPNFVCGQDINNNGYIGDEGEYASCKVATIKNSAPADQSCLVGYTMQANGTCLKYEYVNTSPQCPSGSYIQNGRCLTLEKLQPQAYCPSGSVPAGNGCIYYTYTSPSQSCPSGGYVQNGRCVTQGELQPTQSCARGPGQYNAAAGYCLAIMPSDCSALARDPGLNSLPGFRVANAPSFNCRVMYDPDYLCSQGSLQGNKCVIANDFGPVSLTCPGGSVLENGQCKASTQTNMNYLCPVGTMNNGMCEVIKDAGAVQAVCPANYVIENGQCKKTTPSPVQYSCKTGTLNGTQCLWNTSENYCPIGASESCLNNNGGSSCSTNKCIDITQNPPVDDGNIDGTTLVDDGKKSDEGICLDQVYIFNGRASDCKLAGVSTAFKNCCKSEGKVYSDDVGPSTTVLQAASYVKDIYGAAAEAYTYYTVAMQATADVAVASSMAADAFVNALMATVNPATIAIAIAIHFAMEYLMKACDQMSMETAMEAGSGMCHEVGTYCKKKIPLLGCVQKATSYCCFNSMLGRIIQEQGRPQLTSFNGWGKPESPQCRGFTPEEFQQLDFAKINLDEYVQEMVTKATSEIQQNVTSITQSFYDKTN